MSISPRFMSELRDRLTLSEIIGRRVKLVRAGREFKGCCPFHNEKSPSFYVNDDKQFYHCFGCGAHGDAVEFVMQHDNLAFPEAVEVLAAQAGMQVPAQSPADIERAKTEKSLYALMDDTARFFSERLAAGEGRDAMQYLRERQVSQNMMESFRLGYSPADGHALIKELAAKGYTETQMIEAGVARRSERKGDVYSFFRDRVMFPVTDRRGRIVAFGGRVLPEHIRPLDPGQNKPPKYINSSETSIFHKGRMLYGEAHARQAAADGEPLIVVEGYLDVMACFEAGWRGAVAPLGTALTEEQIAVLWKTMTVEEKTPILCFDGDTAGRRAASRACERILPLLQPYHSALFAFLPEGQDPDSLIRGEGRKAFAAVLDAAMPLVDFIWQEQTAGRRFETPEARAGLAATLEAQALRIPDRSVQQYYRQAFRDRLYKTFGPQKNNVKAFQKKGKFGPEPGADIPLRRPAQGASDRLPTLILLAALVNHPYIFDNIEEALGQLEISDGRIDQLRQAVLAALGAESTLDSAALQSHLKERGYGSELTQILNDAVYVHAGFARPDAPAEIILAGWQDTVRLMNRRMVGNELRQAGQALAQDFSPENEQRIIGLRDIHNADTED